MVDEERCLVDAEGAGRRAAVVKERVREPDPLRAGRRERRDCVAPIERDEAKERRAAIREAALRGPEELVDVPVGTRSRVVWKRRRPQAPVAATGRFVKLPES